MKIRLFVKTNIAGSLAEELVEIPDDISSEEQEIYCEELLEQFVSNVTDSGFEVLD